MLSVCCSCIVVDFHCNIDAVHDEWKWQHAFILFIQSYWFLYTVLVGEIQLISTVVFVELIHRPVRRIVSH